MRAGLVWGVALGGAALMAVAGPASSAEVSLTSAQVVKGRCSDSLHAGRMPRYHGCSSGVFYVEFSNGQNGLVFSNGTSTFYFVGKGTGWKQKTGGRIEVSVLATGWGENFEELPGKGYCRFGNVHSGEKVSIACSATMKTGHWSAAFLTDGKPPVVVDLKD
jgi:hypothetical protein